MNTKSIHTLTQRFYFARVCLAALCLTMLLGSIGLAAPMGTAFTYSGRLKYQGQPANGTFDLQVKLFSDPVLNNQVGLTVTVTGLSVVNGLFVTSLDFGSGIFDGTAYWLELAARPGGGGSYTILTPRQPVNPAPYALFAPVAGTANSAGANAVTATSIQNSAITAAKIASGQVVKSVNGLSDAVTLAAGPNVTLSPSGNTLTIGASASGWALTGNAGTTPGASYLGTSDNAPLELRANGVRGLHMENVGSFSAGHYMNWIGGYVVNRVDNGALGATIAGGGFFSPLLGFDSPNVVGADLGSIGGGAFNTVNGQYGTVPGGFGNSANGQGSFAAGVLASATHDGTFLWNDGRQHAYSTGPNRFEVVAAGGMSLTSPRGIALDAADRPIITRGWDAFDGTAPAEKVGLGRWGLFMEYTQLVLGMPGTDVPGGLRTIAFGRYHLDGSYDALMTLQNTDGAAWFAGQVSCCALEIRGGCDVAEPFRMSQPQIPKGAVVVIDESHPGELKLSERPYDTRVAGIVSGAEGIHPGIALHQEGVLEGGDNVALSGRVYVLADATSNAIHPGDLLTTSSLPGHAMKVADASRAHGAILGKAMSSLEAGQGVVLVLVSLE